jgi:SsrA-binding protein
MSKKESKNEEAPRQIALNRRARFDYFIEDTYEAGIALQGWEVKALRAGRANITEAYVIVKNGEAFLLGAHITPLLQASTHVITDDTRTRKLLLHARQLSELIGKVERAGYTLVPLDLHWTRGRAKLSVGLAKGKKKHDKRADIKQRDWNRERERLLRH